MACMLKPFKNHISYHTVVVKIILEIRTKLNTRIIYVILVLLYFVLYNNV